MARNLKSMSVTKRLHSGSEANSLVAEAMFQSAWPQGRVCRAGRAWPTHGPYLYALSLLGSFGISGWLQ